MLKAFSISLAHAPVALDARQERQDCAKSAKAIIELATEHLIDRLALLAQSWRSWRASRLRMPEQGQLLMRPHGILSTPGILLKGFRASFVFKQGSLFCSIRRSKRPQWAIVAMRSEIVL
jgi:hypothetical protein